MAKAKKLPSGSWRVQVYAGIDENKKKIYKSFTASTKKEAEFLAAEYKVTNKIKKNTSEMTIREAVTRYIDSKDGVLSPSTIRGYRTIARNNLKQIMDTPLKDLNNEKIQTQITLESKTHTPKTVANIAGLLTASLKMFYPEYRVIVSLPSKKARSSTVPVDAQIKALLQLAKGTDIELPIMLAAMGSLRVGEIAALTVEDITDTGVIVNKAMVRNQHQKWEIKNSPKTTAGIRVAPLPAKVLTLLQQQAHGKQGADRLFDLNPESIYERYAKLRNQCGMEKCRFHDLRHYYASMAHALGVPDQYIMQNGGWKDKSTLTRIYQHALSDYAEQENKKITDHFSVLME